MPRATSRYGARDLHQKVRPLPVTAGIAAVTVGLSAIAAGDVRTWFLVPVVVTLAWFVWALVVWPRVITGPEVLVIRNTLTTSTIPYADIDTVSAGLALRVTTEDGRRIIATGVYGRAGMGWDALRTAHAHAQSVVPVRRVDDLRPADARTQASQVGQIILSRIDDAPPATVRTRRTVNWGIVIVSVLLCLSCLTAATIGRG